MPGFKLQKSMTVYDGRRLGFWFISWFVSSSKVKARVQDAMTMSLFTEGYIHCIVVSNCASVRLIVWARVQFWSYLPRLLYKLCICFFFFFNCIESPTTKYYIGTRTHKVHLDQRHKMAIRPACCPQSLTSMAFWFGHYSDIVALTAQRK